MRTMYDSTNPSAIPADAEMVALYVDGMFAATVADWNRFTRAVKVRISAIGENNNAHVFDCEPGCIWPPENVVHNVVEARKLGIEPTVYCNEQNHWQWVAAEFQAAGVAEPLWWVAHYDNLKTVPDQAVAKQYADPGMAGVGGHYDMSVVRDYWRGVDGSFDNPSKSDPNTGGGFMAALTEAEQREVLDKTRAVWAAFWDTANAPAVAGGPGPETVHDLGQRVAKRQQDHIDLSHLISNSVHNIEEMVNVIKNEAASQGLTLTDAQAEGFATKVLASLGNTVKAAVTEGINEVEFAPRPATS